MKITMYSYYFAICLLPFCYVTVNAASGSASGSVGSKNAIAKVIKVTPKEDNDWIVAVADPKSPTGYSVKIKDTLYEHFVSNYFLVFMYARSNPNDKFEIFYASRICELLNPNDKYHPKKNYMPRQIVNIILPGRYGSCNLTASTKPMKASGTVNADPETNPEVTFPKSSPFELIVNILPMKWINNPDTKYFFQVDFTVGGNFQASGSVGGSINGQKGASGGAGVKTG